MMASESKLFCPYKAVGLVASDTPFVLRFLLHQEQYILKVPVGNAFHVYAAKNLAIRGVSELHRSAITCMATGSPHDFTATKDGSIYCWGANTKFVRMLNGHKSQVHSLSLVGTFLLSVDVENNLKVWDVLDGALYLEMEVSKSLFEITVVAHPPTYPNKVLLGSKQGKLRLFNLKTSKVIFEFSGWGSAVTAMEPAPSVLNVVAIGLEDGRIIIHNIEVDETIMTFEQDWGKVTALSFRCDNNARLCSGSAVGHLALWDLEEKCLKSTVENAHDGPIVSLVCAKGEPFAYTASSDNVIKAWIFDMPDGAARLYILRDGHSEPPLRVRFHGATGLDIISGGQDSKMRKTSIDKAECKSMGLACYNRAEVKKANLKVAKKMPPIIHFTTELTREEAWDNIAAVHLNVSEVTTWSFHKAKLNEKMLVHKRFHTEKYKAAMATCIEISACGNYVFIGYDTGHIDMYNIQSGIYKLCYGEKCDRTCAIRGLVSDSLNNWLVSGSQGGGLQWWGLMKGSKDKSIELEAGVQIMNLHRESGLIAVALDNWDLIVADVDTKSVVRKMRGHQNQITDLAFSGDSKWLVSSSMDSSIRTWDLPTGHCIDYFLVPTPATSIALSPIDDYLVSSHVDELGIYVWANRSCLTFVSLQPLKDDYCPPLLSLPASAPDVGMFDDNDSDISDDEEDLDVDDYKSPDQISTNLVTIDLMPTSRWLNLVNIDHIKQRNKPLEAPKVPKSAPFFLESVAGVEAKLNDDGEVNNELQSKIVDRSEFVLESLSPFGILLSKSDHIGAFQKLSKMGPSNIDLEIRNLEPDVGGSRKVMLQFLHMIKNVVQSRNHFEVAQGYLALFLKRHPEYLTTPDTDVEEVCKELYLMHNNSWHILKNDVNKSLCLLSYFKNSAILNY